MAWRIRYFSSTVQLVKRPEAHNLLAGMSTVYFKECRTTWPLSSRGLVNFNPEVSHAIPKDSPERRICVYIYGKLKTELKETPLFPNCIIEIIQVTERSK